MMNFRFDTKQRQALLDCDFDFDINSDNDEYAFVDHDDVEYIIGASTQRDLFTFEIDGDTKHDALTFNAAIYVLKGETR